MHKLTVILLLSTVTLHLIGTVATGGKKGKRQPGRGPKEHNCAKNEEWRAKGPACPPTCETIGQASPPCPSKATKPGCFCKDKYVLGPKKGKHRRHCIPRKRCPK
ncbi:cysteine-rich venom protein 1-like [Dendropsophus ebraccatus]|uniref:cysteine-rich venom protein 1-like n=1 Tax=Dendropsophus ebraccatus TaxID=150705 RepID=UPI0038318748